MTDDELLEQSFNIAWEVLDQSRHLGNPDGAASFLVEKIREMMRRGEKRRLLLSNLAIDAYRMKYQPLQLVS